MKWQDAAKIIGEDEDDDYILDLAKHGERYGKTAPALVELMQFAGVKEASESYHLYDKDAIQAQDEYKKWMFRTNLSALLTSIFSASAMAWNLVPAAIVPPWENGALVLNLLAVGSASIGAAGLFILRSGKLLEKWMNKRAHAETFRISYFEEMVAKGVAAGGDAALLALEYFRRYQLDVQKNYFFLSARRHEKSSITTIKIGAVGAGIAALASVAGLNAEGAWKAIGVCAVFGAALGAYAVGREQMTQDQRNSERYDRTYTALSQLTKKLDAVRPASEARSGSDSVGIHQGRQ